MGPVIAIIYDCDGTLTKDITDFLLEEYGINVDEFWSHVGHLQRDERRGPSRVTN